MYILLYKLARSIRGAKVSKSNVFAYFCIVKLEYVTLSTYLVSIYILLNLVLQ